MIRAATTGAVALATSLFAARDAAAAEGLQWTWDAPLRYYLEADVNYPTRITLQAENNIQSRVWASTTRVVTTCAPYGEPAKRSLEVRCAIDDIAFAAVPQDVDAENLVTVLDETEKMLQGAYVQLEFGYDGRIRAIDLEGFSTKNVNDRVRETQETTRVILIRAFAALDLELPKEGRDGGEPWEQQGALALGFPSLRGSIGSAPVTIQVARESGSLVTLLTRGGGVVGPGETMVTTGQPMNQYDLKITGSATFDTAKHALVARQYTVHGDLTPSSLQAQGGTGVPYIQNVQLRLLAPDEPAPQIGENMLVTP